MRRKTGLKTYGRHKSRVIVTDVWLSDSDGRKNIFGNSSENDSTQSSLFHTSSSSSEQTSLSVDSINNSTHSSFEKQNRLTRLGKKMHLSAGGNKENKISRRKNIKQSHLSKKTSYLTSSHNCSLEESVKSHVGKKISKTSDDAENQSNELPLSEAQNLSSRPLRNRAQRINYNDSTNIQKQLRGATSKRKRPIQKKIVQLGKKEQSINFSDFDDYSLVIQDTSTNERKDVFCIETSTPVAKKTRKQFQLKDSNLSHINIVVSPSSDTCYTSIDTPYSMHTNSNNSEVADFSSPSLVEATNESNKKTKNMYSSDKKSGNKTPECMVLLKKMSESFIERQISSEKIGLLSLRKAKNGLNGSSIRQSANDLNGSDSLFSTPGDYDRNNIQYLTSRLQQISFIDHESDGGLEEEVELDIDKIIQEYQDESEEEEDSAEEEESWRDEELSALVEEKYADSEEAEKDICDSLQNVRENENVKIPTAIADLNGQDEEDKNAEDEFSEEEEESDNCSDEESRNFYKQNLSRLNRSLQNNQVSIRRHACRQKKTSDIDTLKENSDSSGVDLNISGTSLYILNENYSGDNLEMSSSDQSLEQSSDRSKYETAQSPDIVVNEENSDVEESKVDGDDEEEDYHTAGEISSRESLEHLKTPKVRKYSLRERYESLKDSFSEMLTPTKLKGGLIPVSAKTKVMILCDQTEPVSFTTALTKSGLRNCKKIGEGVYGEVFKSSINNQSVAIKIIPIEGDFLVNDEPQKKFEEILPEIVIAKELSDLRYSATCVTATFCEVMSVSCVRGKYPACLLKSWDEFNKAKRSENDRPDMFRDDQLFVIFEFADCGMALESFKTDNLLQSKSILTQVAFALAAAEEALQFEHRDLHWGNVLVRPTKQEEIFFRLTGQEFRVPTFGIEASIIDFTLSRLTKDGCKVYSDLSKDDTLFQGKGDYQFEVYRKMKKHNGNKWEKFCPYTNVIWLHYLADKLVYNSTSSLKSRQERENLREFRQFMVKMLDYCSALEIVMDALFLNS